MADQSDQTSNPNSDEPGNPGQSTPPAPPASPLPPVRPAPPQSETPKPEPFVDVAPIVQPRVDPAAIAADKAAAEHHRRRRRMSAEHIRRIKRRKRIRRILIGVLIVVLAIAGVVGWFVSSALKAKGEVEAAVAQAGNIQSQVLGGDTEAAKASIFALSSHIDATYQQTKSPVWAMATVIPKYGSDVKAVREVMSILEDVSNNALPKLSKSVEGLDLTRIGIRDGAVDLGDMASIATDLTAANKSIADANVKLHNVGGTNIPQLTEALDTAKAKFADLSSLVDLGARTANLMPAMFDLSPTGANDSDGRNYLVLVQNNAELRATGGIFGSWGVLNVRDGKLSMGAFQPAKKLPNGTPGITLTAEEKSLFTDKMVIYQQDPDFTPDFPRAAQISAAMWKALDAQDKNQSPNIDGVIAVDPIFLQELLNAVGPVVLSDGAQLTGHNTVKTLLNDTYLRITDPKGQNAFFFSAAASIFNHLISAVKNDNSAQIVAAVQNAVNKGHIYLWSAHEDEQKQVEGTAISGELVTNPADPVTGVYFNDGTMGKMDWYLKREVTAEYDKTYPTGAKQYTVRIRLTNTADPSSAANLPELIRGYEDGDHSKPRHGEIVTAAYVYAPAGGRLVDWQLTGAGAGNGDFDAVTVHNELTVGVKHITLQPGETFEATVHVMTSPLVEPEREMILRQTPLID